jgi:L-xylulokinase
MARHRPEILDRAAHVVMCKDLVVHALTGQVVSEVSDMGGAGLLALPGNAYDDRLMAAYGLGDLARLLPRLLWPTEVAGQVTASAARSTGLRAGTPAVAGFFDVVAAAVGSGVTRRGEASVILGTWSINQAVVAEPVRGVFMSCGIAPGRFMAMENSATSAANLEWAAHGLMSTPQAFAEADRLAAEAAERPDAPFYLPFLYGSPDDPAARAALVGAAGWHGPADLMRALFEGVAFAHLAHLERLAAAGVATDRIVLSGGGARSPVWPQMLADLLGREVEVTKQPEAGALGAAMAAAVGAGLYAGLDEAAERMAAPTWTVAPRRDSIASARRRFELWRELCERLRQHWSALGATADA